MSDETSNTWLDELRNATSCAPGWQTLLETYGPFVQRILAAQGLERNTAEDVVQNVMMVVIRKLPDFERQRTGSFRSWLREITINCMRECLNSSANRIQATGSSSLHELLQTMQDPNSEFHRKWDQEHTRHVIDATVDVAAESFSPSSIEIFRRLAIGDEDVNQVASDLNMTPNACFVAKSRVMKRVRSLMQEMFGDDDVIRDLLG